MAERLLPAHPSALRGMVALPTSKSLTNRALVAAAVANGGTIVSPLDCDDTRFLASALARAGWRLDWGTEIEIGERSVPADPVELDLGESGTGSRLIVGLLAASPGHSTVDGSTRLRERPMAPLLDTLADLGAEISSNDGALPVEIEGSLLAGGTAEVRPEVSSQYVSSLLMAAPLMSKGLKLAVSGPLPSAPYLDLTLDVLRAFGGDVRVSEDRRLWAVAPGPLERSRYVVEGDWSAAAFFLAGVAVAGGEVAMRPLDPESRQGDRAILEIFVAAGLEAAWDIDRLVVRGPLAAPIVADLRDTPDLFPALVAAAACAQPGSWFSGLDNLKHKESDRLTVMVDNLERLGAKFDRENGNLRIASTVGTEASAPALVTAAGDHRVAMAMAVAALACGPLRLDEPDCVTKSFPGFWKTWHDLMATEDEVRPIP